MLGVERARLGRDEKGEWTGTYHASATIWRQSKEEEGWRVNTSSGEQITEASPGFSDYISKITPPQGGELGGTFAESRISTGKNASGAPMIGIAAGVHDLINVVSSPPGCK